MSSILKTFDLKPVDLVTDNHKRNPWRVLPLDRAEADYTDINEA